ncbi:phytanoyl-CoA dioxygenase family protein [Actinoplanes bogorensis]|uniref:Phytanoyl-CoA dioxygenase family protein n=1 Tax=Paractinoplanes bogorensis TaxID=1610840 RepID=A0ABS5YW82_9ACTN|nr:phytanoyl-CoA dioxygenase family protein [Actinoplanes bogorensis]MBU2666375.1 phytanoyl-CoA dioxygenase family protein [Actinoplanes bogorensis]
MTNTWFTAADCRLEDFRAVCEQKTDLGDYPHATDVVDNVLIYPGDLANTRDIQSELIRALRDGPGIVVFTGAFRTDVVDRATEVFTALIASGESGGDHFAPPGANDRVWGALDKFALRDPVAFAQYYDNDTLALISEAWLGTGYQVTSQVNVVNPGGPAQVAHRDYHLGFMSQEQALRYPAHIHALSPVLTLQGAVAHVDMPVETGPTMYLPHSQKYPAGYVAFHQPSFTDYFNENYVQLPLAKGDAAFFNPALFHGAGTNRSSSVRRMANLLQVSSGFGRAMESVNRTAMVTALYPVLLSYAGSVGNVIAASAEGYAFPTNLDHDQPLDGLAPRTQADLLRQAVAERWPANRFESELAAADARRHA